MIGMLVLEPNKYRRLIHCLSFRDNRIGGKTDIWIAHGNTDHNDLVIRNAGVLSHDRGLHDPLAVDDTSQASRPGGID